MTSFSRAGIRPGPGRCLVSVPADGATPDALLRMSRRQRRSLRTGKLPAKNGRALAKIFLSKGEGVEQKSGKEGLVNRETALCCLASAAQQGERARRSGESDRARYERQRRG